MTFRAKQLQSYFSGFSHRSLFVKKLLTIKASNYFPALHEESNNFKGRKI